MEVRTQVLLVSNLKMYVFGCMYVYLCECLVNVCLSVCVLKVSLSVCMFVCMSGVGVYMYMHMYL